MKINGTPYCSIWYEQDTSEVKIIDQRWLPYEFKIVTLSTLNEFAAAIAEMWVRGAPLIGATAAYGMAEQMRRDASDESLAEAWDELHATRPTAINLKWALDRCRNRLQSLPLTARAQAALELAHQIREEDIETNRNLGLHGLALIEKIAQQKGAGEPVRILTHCNAGWLATVDYGTATSPMYHAADAGIPLHIWVDETRPRNQGALTSWELGGYGIEHQYITDNAGGHLMQHGLVDMVIVGTDRTTASGDVCNKIGTYLKALAAYDNKVPFYVALPSSTIDWTVNDGVLEIPIEEREATEVTHISGINAEGAVSQVQITPDQTGAANPAFDVTPARLVTGLITERGVCDASSEALAALFPDLIGKP